MLYPTLQGAAKTIVCNFYKTLTDFRNSFIGRKFVTKSSLKMSSHFKKQRWKIWHFWLKLANGLAVASPQERKAWNERNKKLSPLMLRLHGAMSMCINIIIIQQNKKNLKKHQRQLLMDNHFLAAWVTSDRATRPTWRCHNGHSNFAQVELVHLMEAD